MTQPTNPVGESGQDRSDVAHDKGHEVAGHAREEGRQVTETARDQAGRVTDETRRQAMGIMDEARQQIREQARTQTERAGGAMEDLGARVQALAEGRPEEAGPLPEYADRVASRVDELAGRVNELGVDGILEETQRFARRRPGAFLLGAAVAGFAVARLGRGAKEADGASGAASGGSRGNVAPWPERPASTPPAAPSQGGPVQTGRYGQDLPPHTAESEVRP